MSLGRSPARPDARDKVSGTARYPGDRWPVGVLHAFVVFTDQPHARLSKLDTSAAEAAEGVVCVVTAADVPINEYGLTMFDQPVLVGPGPTPAGRVPQDVSRWEADHLAVVVAETAELAQAAAQLIETEWDPLPIVADIDAAMAEGAPLLHPEHPSGSNRYHGYKTRKGDIDSAFERADIVIEGTYEVPFQEHAYLQPEAGLAYLDDEERITLEVAGQWTHEDREQVAHALGLAAEQVRVIYPPIGGAFGGREDMSLQIVLALAVQKLRSLGIQRPVRAQWSREESIVGHHKRHRGRVHARLAATREGIILGVEATSYLDAGGYNYTSNKVLGNLHLSVAGAYEVPAARIDSAVVYTNAVPGGAFRGFGGPQGCFVAETQMNRLAAALHLDPVEVRRRNLLGEGSVGITGTVMPAGVSLPDVVEICADAADWDRPPPPPRPVQAFASLPPTAASARRGRGFACAYKNIGFSFGFPERSVADIVLYGSDLDGSDLDGSDLDGSDLDGSDLDGSDLDGSDLDGSDLDGSGPDVPVRAELHLAGAEVGQGAHLAFVQMAAEATGLPVEAITPVFSDTATSGDSGSASASRLSWMTGNAILGAAEEAEKAWQEGARPAHGHFRYTPPPTEMLDPEGIAPTVPNFAYGYVAEAVDLTVDIETGHIVVHDVVCAVDVGRVINPQLATGQVEGAIAQAHGYAISEELLVVDGRVLNPRLSGYLIPGIGDVPERVRPVLVEVPDPRGPFGVRGMAEMPMLPYAPAVVAALYEATGVWFETFPLTPTRVRAGLRAAGVNPVVAAGGDSRSDGSGL